jgi:hypothetical protein
MPNACKSQQIGKRSATITTAIRGGLRSITTTITITIEAREVLRSASRSERCGEKGSIATGDVPLFKT